MSIEKWARETQGEVAVRMAGSGETLTFAELDQAVFYFRLLLITTWFMVKWLELAPLFCTPPPPVLLMIARLVKVAEDVAL